MNILSIGSDRSVVTPHSAAAKRQIAYSQHFNDVALIVFTQGGAPAKITLSPGLHVYTTASRSRLWYGVDAFQIARNLPRPDVVTVQDPFEIGLIGWVIARMRGAKLHVQVHTDFLAPEFRGFLHLLRRMIARFVLRRADRIRVVSFRIQDGLERARLVRAPITILPIYIDIASFSSAHAGVLAGRFSKFRKRLLFVGRLEKEKNASLAIESFVVAAPHDACLIIVGDGSERRALEKRVARRGASARVFFESHTDPIPYYAVADLLLVTSHFEGYGLVIVEALAAHKPVLSTDVGVAREAGAIVTDALHFTDALKAWFESGPFVGALQHYPYRSFEEYVEAYAHDITSSNPQKNALAEKSVS